MKYHDTPKYHSNCDAAKLRIEPEIQHLLPPLGEAEQAGLEADILQRGVLSPLVAWNDILIDGHHRYAICQKHGLPFYVLSLDFESFETAKLWTWRHQENRRNLTPYQRVEISLQFKPLIEAEAKERQIRKPVDFVPMNSWEQKERDEVQKIKAMKMPYDSERASIANIQRQIARERRNFTRSLEMEIYFALVDGNLKIGSSNDPDDRIKAFQTSSVDVRLIASIKYGRDAKKFENKLKEKFAHYHIAGEMYRYTPDICQEIIQYTQREASRNNETGQIIAELANVSNDTVTRVEYLNEHAGESVKDKLRKGETTINAEYKRLKKEIGQREREAQKQVAVQIPLDDRVRLHVASIAEAVGHVEAQSVDMIVTDPPYPREYLGVYDDLAGFAQHVLKPGGSLLCMAGQSYLPEIMQKLCGKLDYRWMLAYLTPGGQATQLWERKVNTFWKPVLWLVKGEYKGDWIGDVANSKSNDNDKRHHHWGQSESGMFDLMQRFLYPNMTVCDPFLGGGTTGTVALALGCRFIGMDVDQECVEKTRARLARTLLELKEKHDS